VKGKQNSPVNKPVMSHSIAETSFVQAANLSAPCIENLDSVVRIATGYGLDDRGIGVQVPVGSRIFSSLRFPDRLWVPPNFLANGYQGFFPGAKAAGA
jgi:hypothetical protein